MVEEGGGGGRHEVNYHLHHIPYRRHVLNAELTSDSVMREANDEEMKKG